ncbi:MAG: VWA domain-containing protein [Gemmataceae bacterium]
MSSLFAIFDAPLSAAAVAGAAVSIPVIIHLLNRRRFKVVEWAAMRFLLTAQRKNARRMRIEQLLLLLVRCLVVLGLVLAMASVSPWAESLWRWLNPAGGKGFLAGGTRTHRILVVDGSLSMSVRHGEQTCFDRARAFAEKVVEEGAGSDGFSVVLMAAPPRRVVPEPSEDARKVIAEVRNLRMTHGNGDLAGTLATVASLLKASPGKFPAKEVYFITDLQRSNWISDRPGDLAAALQTFQELKAKAVFVDVGRDGVSNLAVTTLEVGEPVVTTQGKVPILANLYNWGDTREDVAVRLFVGKAKAAGDEKTLVREVAATTVRARRGQQTPVAFTHRFPAPGEYVVQVQTTRDDVELDDVRSAVVRVRNTVPVLLVNGKPASELFDRAAGWLRVALNPFDEGREVPPGVVFRPKVLTPFQFADAKLGDLTNYDVVCLCDVPTFSPDEVRRLEAHVRMGGAAVFSLGDQVDLGRYNDALYKDGQGLLPARLLHVQRATPGYAYQLSIDPDADRHDPLRAFQDDSARERLLAPFFNAFVQAEPARAVRGVVPRRILGFSPTPLPGKAGGGRSAPPPGGAAVLEWRPPLPGARPTDRDLEAAKNAPVVHPGRGRVALVTTTVNSDWSRWPASPAFPAFVQELLFYTAQQRLRERLLSVGEPVELYLASPAVVEATVEMPRDPFEAQSREEDGTRKVNTQTLPDGSVLRFGETDVSGVYKVRLGSHPQEHLFAVNVPAATDDQRQSESNPTRTDKDELVKTYPEWDAQVVTDLKQVTHAQAVASAAGETVYAPQGDGVARVLLLVVLGLVFLEVVFAWQFGHYSASPSALPEQEAARRPGWARWALWAAPWALFALLGGVAFILVHNAATGDFLAFLPERLRAVVERAFDIPPPAPGEGSRWRLEFASYFWDAKSDPWLVGALAVLASAAVGLIYWQEGTAVRSGFRAMLLALRTGLLLLLLVVFLPQLKLHFERQGWPDVVLLVDDSGSMSTFDVYRDDKEKAAADALAKKAELTELEKAELARSLATRPDLTRASRVRLAQTFLAGQGDEWLRDLLLRRKVRLHVYHCSTRAHRVASVSSEEELESAVKAVKEMAADPSHDSSQLGTAVRQVLNDFRGSSLAAVIMLTDGVTTEGEDLAGVSKYAAQMGVPLFFVGVGDAQELRDVYLHDLQCEDVVHVGDTIIFELKLTAQGYKQMALPVSLYEKGSDRPLGPPKVVNVDPDTKTVKVRLEHKPATAGDKTYVIRVPVQEGEVDKENNVLEKQVYVREAKQVKVLYVEGYRRYEYQYLKTLLERESNKVRGNKSVNLKVLLLDADPDFPLQDRTALGSFPTPFRNVDTHTRDDDLWSYDVVILGDIDPEPRGDNRMNEHLKNVADFVRERGGGLLVLAGERFSPQALKNSPLKDVLPIDLVPERASDIDAEDGLIDTYRMELTPIGRSHPMFRFSPDEKESEDVWAKLKEFYWFSDGYVPKRAAEVLATHPTLKGVNKKTPEKHPLIVQQFAGSGRCMFFGANELWRWNWREDQRHYNQFWIQTIRYLARTRVGKIELRLDRQTPYRRGEPIKVMVRFPDDERPPPEKTEVKVVVERKVPGKPGEGHKETVQLAKLEGSRATYETILTRTPEGEYDFKLTEPAAKPRPEARCKVLAPPGEMERLRMNQPEMEAAATATQGRFYTLATADRLADELPPGTRVTVNAAGPPFLLWNLSALFLLALGLLTTEWLLRKQKNLL